MKEMSFKVDAGLSFKFSKTEESMSEKASSVEAGVEYEKKTMIKEFSEYTTIKVNVK